MIATQEMDAYYPDIYNKIVGEKKGTSKPFRVYQDAGLNTLLNPNK